MKMSRTLITAFALLVVLSSFGCTTREEYGFVETVPNAATQQQMQWYAWPQGTQLSQLGNVQPVPVQPPATMNQLQPVPHNQVPFFQNGQVPTVVAPTVGSYMPQGTTTRYHHVVKDNTLAAQYGMVLFDRALNGFMFFGLPHIIHGGKWHGHGHRPPRHR